MSTHERTINHQLRQALHAARLSDADAAIRIGVDPKTVNRWIAGRPPHPRHRYAMADLLRRDVHELWPQFTPTGTPPATGELLAVYPHRSAVPVPTWHALFEGAREHIDVLVYSGLFLAEDPHIQRTLAERANDGVRVRLLLGDPDGENVARRGAEEGIGDAMAAKVRNALVLYQPLTTHPGIEIRLHNTPLYASIYRADTDLLINTHIHRTAAASAPVHHLRRTTDSTTQTSTDPARSGVAHRYLDAFNTTWTDATSHNTPAT